MANNIPSVTPAAPINKQVGDGFKTTPASALFNPAKSSSAPIDSKIAAIVTPPVSTVPIEVAKPAIDPRQADLDRRFNALVAKEKAIAQRSQQSAAKAKQQEQRIAELEAKLQGYQPAEQVKTSYQNDLKARALQNPLDVMKDLGLSYEQLTQYVLNDNKPTPELVESRLQREIQAIRDEQSKSLQTQQEALRQQQDQYKQQQVEQYNQAIAQVKSEINDFVGARPEDYALISKNEASETVFEVMNQHYEGTGRIMKIEEACKLVEDYLEEQALDLFKIAKLQAKLSAKPANSVPVEGIATDNSLVVDPEAQIQSKPKWVPTSRTLTHEAATDGRILANKENLTAQERKAKVLAKYNLR